MGLFSRPDSPWWWYLLEGSGTRRSTGIPKAGASPEQTRELKRQALEIYFDAKATHRPGPKTRTQAISFKDFSDWYERHEIAHQRGAVRGRSMLRQLALYFNRVKDISTIDLEMAREWMTWRRAHVSPGTVNRELDVLRALLRKAVPKYLPVYQLGDIRRFRQEETEPRVLTVEEETRLIAACGPDDLALILTALDTLLRLGSLLALEWPQVKLDQRILLPLNAKVKTGAKPLSTRAHAALSALPSGGRYVFGSLRDDDASYVSAKHKAIRRFTLLCQLANIRQGRAIGGITFHCLRHTGATRALQRGASIRTVMELGGWKGEQMVMRYAHTSDADVRAAAESIGNHGTITSSKAG